MTTPDSLSANLARILTAYLVGHGRSVNSLSDSTGIPYPTLRRRLNGTAPFKTNEIDMIARELGLDVAELVIAASRDAA